MGKNDRNKKRNQKQKNTENFFEYDQNGRWPVAEIHVTEINANSKDSPDTSSFKDHSSTFFLSPKKVTSEAPDDQEWTLIEKSDCSEIKGVENQRGRSKY